MSNAALFVSLTLGVIFYLFFYWRRSREDYSSEIIFTGSLFVLFLTFLSSFLASKIEFNNIYANVFNTGGVWFWGGLFGLAISIFILRIKLKIKLYETFEAAGIGMLGVLAGFLVPRPEALLPVILFAIFVILDIRYRKFSWYKSGRVGFAGFTTFGIFFLIRSALATTNLDIIFLVGKLDSVTSAAMAFLMFFMVYNLAERN